MVDIPIDHVLAMRQQGLSNNQIVASLQRAGYPIDVINDALSQADIKEGIAPGYASPAGAAGMQAAPHAAGYPAYAEYTQPAGPTGGVSDDAEERIQEIAEAIIDEKWSSLLESINTIADWKEKTEGRLIKIETQMQELKDNFDRLHEGVIGKISEYNKGIQDIGVDIKALEKVFQKILPGFVENVNELSRITQRVKKQAV